MNLKGYSGAAAAEAGGWTASAGIMSEDGGRPLLDRLFRFVQPSPVTGYWPTPRQFAEGVGD